jgi:hypothetical protein
MQQALLIATLALVAALGAVDAKGQKVLEVMHCRGGKVQSGDTTYEVFKKCGEPAYKEVVSGEDEDKREVWHYDCKGRGYIDILEFSAGKLADRQRGADSHGVQECR